MKFSTTITLVLTCPPFIMAGVAGILTGWSSGRLHERTWHITVGLAVAIVGFAIAASNMNTASRYVACFIFPVGAYSVNSVIIGWASSTLSQTKEKKAVRTRTEGRRLGTVTNNTCTGRVGHDECRRPNWLYLRRLSV